MKDDDILEKLYKLKRTDRQKDALIRQLKNELRTAWARADMFEGALKTKQNYYIPSNGDWYRGEDGVMHENRD